MPIVNFVHDFNTFQPSSMLRYPPKNNAQRTEIAHKKDHIHQALSAHMSANSCNEYSLKENCSTCEEFYAIGN